jgi:membrane-associated phospholipid phosphatase
MSFNLSKSHNLKLLPVEKVFFIYIIITGLLEIFFYSKLSGVWSHLLFRLFIIALIIFLSVLNGMGDERLHLKTIRIFLPFVFIAYFYKETDYLNNLIFTQNLDSIISSWEKVIFGFQPSLSFGGRFRSDLFAELMYMGYFSYYLIAVGIPFYIYYKVDHKTGEKFGFIVITSFLIFYLFFIIFPVGGPQFYYIDWPEKLPDGYFFGPLLRKIQYYGEGATAAFPSAHVSVSMILLMGSFLYSKNLLKIIIPITIILTFSTVYIRAHYLIDVITGIFIAPVLFWLSAGIYNIFEPSTESGNEIGEFVKKKLATGKLFKKG